MRIFVLVALFFTCLTQVSAQSYSWTYSLTGVCSVNCGNGVEQRLIYCIENSLQRKTVLDVFCGDAVKPDSTQPCKLKDCVAEVFDWKYSEYNACTRSCGIGTMTRTVLCVNSVGVSSPLTSCNQAARPISVTQCNTLACTTATGGGVLGGYMWFVGAPSKCSVSCGGGILTKDVWCRDSLGARVNDLMCTQSGLTVKPATVELCNKFACQTCTWNVGSPSGCSVPCNGGIAIRSVMCLDQYAVACSLCKTVAPPSLLTCNTQVCAKITGDPEFIGLAGQKFEVHGIPQQYFNLITSPLLQYNAQFVYISEPSNHSSTCDIHRTHPFTHAGTYLGQLGLKTGNDRILLNAGNCIYGINSVTVNGKDLSIGQRIILASVIDRDDIVQMVYRIDKYTVQLSLAEVDITLTNSDHFFNQQVELTSYGKYVHGTHGLLGQTWNNVTYTASNGHKRVYQGSVSDYLIQDEDVFGDDFQYNKFVDPSAQ